VNVTAIIAKVIAKINLFMVAASPVIRLCVSLERTGSAPSRPRQPTALIEIDLALRLDQFAHADVCVYRWIT